jgi:hypothetical protein
MLLSIEYIDHRVDSLISIDNLLKFVRNTFSDNDLVLFIFLNFKSFS